MKTLPEKPLIALTMGDPSGIGPEIILKTLQDPLIYERCLPFVIGQEAPFLEMAKTLGIKPRIQKTDGPPSADSCFGPETLILLPSGEPGEKTAFGVPTSGGGKAAGLAIEKGARLALAGKVDALTTAPINKETLKAAGFPYPGHTEFLAALSGVSDFGMMITGGPLRVVFVTVHEAVAKVPSLVKKERVLKTILLACRETENLFGIPRPAIGVASLNPHGGENGLFGEEELREILPAVREARNAGHAVTNPISPDALFYKAYHGEFDAVVVMYHDQGLIPLKMIAFKKSVNLTLGLPFIRTSVDHGTAYDIAGKGEADPGSLREALFLAAELSLKRKTGTS